jgi:hypothetical protein
MTFGVAGSFSDPFVLSGNTSTASLQTFTRVFVAGAASGALFFDHAGGDGAGIILDNVLLQTVDATVVPVPAALPLMVAGLAGLGVAARRRR